MYRHQAGTTRRMPPHSSPRGGHGRCPRHHRGRHLHGRSQEVLLVCGTEGNEDEDPIPQTSPLSGRGPSSTRSIASARRCCSGGWWRCFGSSLSSHHCSTPMRRRRHGDDRRRRRRCRRPSSPLHREDGHFCHHNCRGKACVGPAVPCCRWAHWTTAEPVAAPS